MPPITTPMLVIFITFLSFTSFKPVVSNSREVLECIPVALEGYDVVYYFQTNTSCDSKQGNSNYTYNINSADSDGNLRTYQFWFISQENLELFSSDPWKYLPKYGGFCSWGTCCELSDDGWKWSATFLGPPAGPDPLDCGFRVYNGSLYFNIWNYYDSKFFENSTREKHIKAADNRWIGWFGSLKAGIFNWNCFSHVYTYDSCPYIKQKYAPLSMNVERCNYQACNNINDFGSPVCMFTSYMFYFTYTFCIFLFLFFVCGLHVCVCVCVIFIIFGLQYLYHFIQIILH